jgi:hypothetical protein
LQPKTAPGEDPPFRLDVTRKDQIYKKFRQSAAILVQPEEVEYVSRAKELKNVDGIAHIVLFLCAPGNVVLFTTPSGPARLSSEAMSKFQIPVYHSF